MSDPSPASAISIATTRKTVANELSRRCERTGSLVTTSLLPSPAWRGASGQVSNKVHRKIACIGLEEKSRGSRAQKAVIWHYWISGHSLFRQDKSVRHQSPIATACLGIAPKSESPDLCDDESGNQIRQGHNYSMKSMNPNPPCCDDAQQIFPQWRVLPSVDPVRPCPQMGSRRSSRNRRDGRGSRHGRGSARGGLRRGPGRRCRASGRW